MGSQSAWRVLGPWCFRAGRAGEGEAAYRGLTDGLGHQEVQRNEGWQIPAAVKP